MAKFKSVDNRLFRDFQRAGFDHDDGLFRSGDDDVQQALLLLRNGGIGDELAIQQTYANAGNGLLKRQVRHIAGRRRPGDGDDIRIIVAVGGEHHADNLRFVAPGFGEERTKRAINQPGSENLFFRRAPLALEKAPGNFSCGIGIFAIVYGKRKKVSVIGFDAITESLQAIQKGDQTADVDQYPGAQSSTALDMLEAYLTKGTKPTQHDTYLPPVLIDKNNLPCAAFFGDLMKAMATQAAAGSTPMPVATVDPSMCKPLTGPAGAAATMAATAAK